MGHACSRGDRPSLPHKLPKPRQRRLKLYTPQPPKYNHPAEWPAWTDRTVFTTHDVPPAEWPDKVGRVVFEPTAAPDRLQVFTQYPLDGPTGQGGCGS